MPMFFCRCGPVCVLTLGLTSVRQPSLETNGYAGDFKQRRVSTLYSAPMCDTGGIAEASCSKADLTTELRRALQSMRLPVMPSSKRVKRTREGDSIFQQLQPPQTLKLCPQPHSDFLLGLLNTNLSAPSGEAVSMTCNRGRLHPPGHKAVTRCQPRCSRSPSPCLSGT